METYRGLFQGKVKRRRLKPEGRDKHGKTERRTGTDFSVTLKAPALSLPRIVSTTRKPV